MVAFLHKRGSNQINFNQRIWIENCLIWAGNPTMIEGQALEVGARLRKFQCVHLLLSVKRIIRLRSPIRYTLQSWESFLNILLKFKSRKYDLEIHKVKQCNFGYKTPQNHPKNIKCYALNVMAITKRTKLNLSISTMYFEHYKLLEKLAQVLWNLGLIFVEYQFFTGSWG